MTEEDQKIHGRVHDKAFTRTKGFFTNPIRAALIFAIAGLGWILLTDLLTWHLAESTTSLLLVQLAKGALFVLLSSALVYWLVRRSIDDTEREFFRTELNLQRANFEKLAGNMTEGYQVIDFEWRYRFLNDAALDHARKSREELLGRTMTDVYPGIDQTDMFQLLLDAMENRQPHQFENTFIYPDRTTADFFLSVFPVEAGIGIISIDLSDVRRAEQTVLEREKNLIQLAERSKHLVWTMDLAYNFTYVNPIVKSLFGYSSNEVTNTNLSQYLSPDDFQWITQKMEAILKSEQKHQSLVLETDFINHTGKLVAVELHARAILSAEGKPVSLQGITRDITEQKRAQKEQEKLIARLSSLRRIDQLINSLAPVELGLQQVVLEAINSMEIDAAAILLKTGPHKVLQTAAHHGFYHPDSTGIELRQNDGYAGKAAMNRVTVSAENIQAPSSEFTRSEMATREGFHAYGCTPIIVKGNLLGLLEVFRKEDRAPSEDTLDFMQTLAGQAGILMDTLTSFKELNIANDQLFLAYDANIEGWSRALDYRDRETEGHSQRVTEITIALAELIGVPQDQFKYIRWGALLHDIGKMGIPDSILHKPGKLTGQEWEIMKLHPTIARDLLKPIIYLEPSLDIPYCHHEHWDGSGYPRGIHGDDIPLAARIFSVADVWDALRSNRPYRPAWPEAQVLEHLKDIAGTHLDPQMIALFLAQWKNIPAARLSGSSNHHTPK
jgi:PAS domain S-box-containing protein